MNNYHFLQVIELYQPFGVLNLIAINNEHNNYMIRLPPNRNIFYLQIETFHGTDYSSS